MAGTSEAARERTVLHGKTITGGRWWAALIARLVRWAQARPWALPALAATAGLAMRVWLVARTGAMIDGDEAMVGIQAERILHGVYPTYFYGQAYMGVLEAYLAAPLVALLGPSGWALRLVPIGLSVLLVYLTWRLAWALLPANAPTTPLLAGMAAFVAAVPPLYDAVAEMRAWGGQVEVYVITVALLLCAVRLADRLRAGAGPAALARCWLVLGFVAGLGIWVNPLITYALLAAALWLVPAAVTRAAPSIGARFARLLRRPPQRTSRTGWSPAVPLGALALLPGLAVGGLPAWVYAARHAGENLLVYVTQPSVDPAVSGAARHGRLFLGAAITVRYLTCVGPNVLDGRIPTESLALLPLRLLLLLPPLAALVGAGWLLWRRRATSARLGLPLLYVGVVTAIFCLGTSAWAATKSCASDLAGRYAVPLALVEPVLLLGLVALSALVAAWHAHRSPGDADNAARAEAAAAGDGVSGRGLKLALGVLLVAGVLQTGTYVTASPTQTFQSPYYHRIPADTSQLLAYLSAHDIHAAWCNHWLGNIVTYETNGATICADYYDQVVQHGIQRPPGTLATVSAADRPSFILILTDPQPCLARELDAQGIGYTMRVLDAAGVTVITPDRTVNPASVVGGLGQDYTEQGISESACPVSAVASVGTDG